MDDFPAVWNCGRLSAKFLVSSIKVNDTLGFCRFFKVLLEQLLKFLKNIVWVLLCTCGITECVPFIRVMRLPSFMVKSYLVLQFSS